MLLSLGAINSLRRLIGLVSTNIFFSLEIFILSGLQMFATFFALIYFAVVSKAHLDLLRKSLFNINLEKTRGPWVIVCDINKQLTKIADIQRTRIYCPPDVVVFCAIAFRIKSFHVTYSAIFLKDTFFYGEQSKSSILKKHLRKCITHNSHESLQFNFCVSAKILLSFLSKNMIFSKAGGFCFSLFSTTNIV